MVRMCIVLVSIVTGVFGSGCTNNDPPTPLSEVEFKREGSLTILRGDEPLSSVVIEIADTDSTRDRGLMERNALPQNSGMLFVFDEATPQRFWMANTRISLDFIFAAADGSIVHIKKYVRPLSQDPVESAAPALYVLELPAGYLDSIGIVEGDVIEFTYD